MSNIKLSINYDFVQRFQLYRNRQPFDMTDATYVAAALIDPLDNTIVLEAVELQDSVGGADWATSLIAVVFSETLTEALEETLDTKYDGSIEIELLLEIRVELEGISEAWKHRPISVQRGFITA